MKEHPILFSGEMVRAILDGRKMQTRRVVPKKLTDRYLSVRVTGELAITPSAEEFYLGAAQWRVGDRLWVRETFCTCIDERGFDEGFAPSTNTCFRADGHAECEADEMTWTPSIHMPRRASRITLEVTAVRVERVQDISEEDAIAEGMHTDEEYSDLSAECKPSGIPCLQCNGTGLYTAYSMMGSCPDVDCNDCDSPVKRFRLVWDSISAKRGFGWDANPWVWVIEFRRI